MKDCVLQCVAVCCSVVQYVVVYCSGLQYVVVCCSGLQCFAVCCSTPIDSEVSYQLSTCCCEKKSRRHEKDNQDAKSRALPAGP